MRSPKAISVGTGWYWLAGVLAALVGLWFYVAVVDPILPAPAWHRAHSRKMQFAEFSLDVPLLWYVPKADFQQPDDIDIDKATYNLASRSSIRLSRGKKALCAGCTERATDVMRSLGMDMRLSHTTYALPAETMDCTYGSSQNGSRILMWCFGEKTNAVLMFDGTKSDFGKLREIVH